MHYYKFILLSVLLASPVLPAAAIDDKVASPVIAGEIRTTRVHGGETLMEVARREGLGFENLVNSNQQLDPWKPGEGNQVTLPGKAILPAGATPGIVINLAELRLFHIQKTPLDKQSVTIYPLGIGRKGRETPQGTYRVVVKQEDPVWQVPAGLRLEDPKMPLIVPPGPENPLGSYWLGLSAHGYGVHGTNRPLGVGRRISYGCLRMYPEDIATLYNQVSVGTPVTITYQPVKAAWSGEHLLLEAHPDYQGHHKDLFQEALKVISKTGWPDEIDYAKVKDVVNAQRSLPEIVGRQSQTQ